MLETVRIRQSGYNVRLTFEVSQCVRFIKSNDNKEVCKLDEELAMIQVAVGWMLEIGSLYYTYNNKLVVQM